MFEDYPLRHTIAATWLQFPDPYALPMPVLTSWPSEADVPSDGVARLVLVHEGVVYQLVRGDSFEALGGGVA